MVLPVARVEKCLPTNLEKSVFRYKSHKTGLVGIISQKKF